MEQTNRETTIYQSFAIQGRVLWALLIRETVTRFGRHNIGFLWLFVEPAMFTTGVAMIWLYIHQRQDLGEVTVLSFVLTGYSTVLIWRNATSRCVHAIQPNIGLLHHRNVQVLDIVLARVILEISGATISIIVLLTIFASFKVIAAPVNVPLMAAGWGLLSMYSLGVAMIVGSLAYFSDIVERTYHVLLYLYLPLSGSLYMVDWLPVQAQKYVLWIPTVNAIEMVRRGYYSEHVHTYYNLLYIVFVNMALLFIGLIMVRETGKRLEF